MKGANCCFFRWIRYLFDWKTPSGYLVAWLAQCAGAPAIGSMYWKCAAATAYSQRIYILITFSDILLQVFSFSLQILWLDPVCFLTSSLKILQRMWLHSTPSLSQQQRKIVQNWRNIFVTWYKFTRMQNSKYLNKFYKMKEMSLITYW